MSVYVPAELRRMVRKQFSDRCGYCHSSESLTVTIFEIEHIIPRAAGGETVFSNLCLACPSCNRYKSDRVRGDQDIRLFHPQQDDWSEHFGWSVDGNRGWPFQSRRRNHYRIKNQPSQMIRVRRMWTAFSEHPPKD